MTFADRLVEEESESVSVVLFVLVDHIDGQAQVRYCQRDRPLTHYKGSQNQQQEASEETAVYPVRDEAFNHGQWFAVMSNGAADKPPRAGKPQAFSPGVGLIRVVGVTLMGPPTGQEVQIHRPS